VLGLAVVGIVGQLAIGRRSHLSQVLPDDLVVRDGIACQAESRCCRKSSDGKKPLFIRCHDQYKYLKTKNSLPARQTAL
jgi:hypothetical protein